MDNQTISITGADTITIDGRAINDVADENYGEIEFPNSIAEVKTGKNGNSIFASNASGRQGDLKLRIIRGSPDDQFLNSYIQEWLADPPSFVLMSGELVKRQGDGLSNVNFDSYLLSNGVPTKNVPAVSNAQGATDPGVAVYEFKFTVVDRVIL